MRKLAAIILVLLLTPFVQADSVQTIQVGFSGIFSTPEISIETLRGIDQYAIAGTSTGVYVFSLDGKIENIIQTSSPVTNFVVLGDLDDNGNSEILVTTLDTHFPNVQVYDSLTGDALWEFSPKLEVFDVQVLWTQKQTSVFDVEKVDDVNGDGFDDVVITSGYGVYGLSAKDGKQLWRFEAEDNVWKIISIFDHTGDSMRDVLVGDQTGYLHLIDARTGKLQRSIFASQDYTITNPQTNSIVGDVTRSVWDIEVTGDGIITTSEDGFVRMFNAGNGEMIWETEIIEFVDSILYSYYGDSPRPSGVGSYNFFNIHVSNVGNIIGDESEDVLVWSYIGRRNGDFKGKQGIYLLDGSNGGISWRNENVDLNSIAAPSFLKFDSEYIALPLGKSGGREKIRLLDIKTGNSYRTINTNSTSSGSFNSRYFMKNINNNFLYSSDSGDFTFVTSSGSVRWSIPRLGSVWVEYADLTGDSTVDIIVGSRNGADDENPFDRGKSRIIFVVDGQTKELVWSYILPLFTFLDTGGLSGITLTDVNGDGKKDVISYLQEPDDGGMRDFLGRNTRLLSFNGKTGSFIFNRSTVKPDFYGHAPIGSIDDIARQQTLNQFGISESDLASSSQEQLSEFNEQLERNKQQLEQGGSDSQIQKKIESIDIIGDYNGDNIDDLIIGASNDVFIVDPVDGAVLWNKTSRPHVYNNPDTGETPYSLELNWSKSDRLTFIVVGDANGDNKDDLVIADWQEILFLHSISAASDLEYNVINRIDPSGGFDKRNLRNIGDINGDGVDDIIIDRWMEDSPSFFVILNGRNGNTIFESEKNGNSLLIGEGDFDGDNIGDSISFKMWGQGGPSLEVINNIGQIVWSYDGIDDTWQITDTFNHRLVSPAVGVGDINGDGVDDVAVGRSLSWDPGAEVIIYNVKENSVIKKIEVEQLGGGDDRRWNPAINAKLLPDLTDDGNPELGVIVATGQGGNKQVKLVIVDMHAGHAISDFSSRGKEIINLEGSVGVAGGSGSLFILDTENSISVSIESETSPLSVKWSGTTSGDSNTILVDGVSTAQSVDKEVTFDISKGIHTVTLYSVDRFGKGVYASTDVNISKDTSLFFKMSLLVAALFGILFYSPLSVILRRFKR